MKKILVILLSLLMVLCIAGCGEYKPPVDNVGGDTPGNQQPGGDNPVNPGDPDSTAFTVQLYYNNRPFTRTKNIAALWHDLSSNAIYRCDLVDGFASVDGLDGDYKVTLSALPDGYTYDPNNNYTDNDNRSIRVYLYLINTPNIVSTLNVNGTNWRLINVNNIRGAFRATITGPDETLRYVYTTGDYGVYSIESIIDTTANVINPILDVYDGSAVYINESSRFTQDNGGAVNTYTKNFRFERTMKRGWVFVFCIRAEGLNANAYPIDIDFLIDKDGELTPDEQYETVEAKQAKPYNFPSGTFKTVASLDTTGRNILNGKLFKLDDRETVDGQPNPEYGYYRFYDEETDTFGGTLFTKISKDWEFVATETRMGFLDPKVAKRFYGKNYTSMINSYAAYVNGDGVYPVTEELKNYLYNYSVSQGYFLDGNGWAETEGKYNSSEQNQWLFSCGYYNR